MKKFLALLLLLSVVGVTLAEVKIDGQRTVKDRAIIKLKVANAKPGTVMWDVFDAARNRLKVETDERLQGDLWFVAPGPGEYEVEAIYVDFDQKKFDRGRATITVEGVVPPIPPKPPDPPIPPVPPPSPSPITQPGFRVMIIEESAERTKLPASQAVIATSKRLQDYLRAKCVTDAQNKSGAFRIWDKDTDPANDTDPAWTAEALKRPRLPQPDPDTGKTPPSMPWIVIGNHPNGGYEGPLPLTVDATLALLTKVAEAKANPNKKTPTRKPVSGEIKGGDR